MGWELCQRARRVGGVALALGSLPFGPLMWNPKGVWAWGPASVEYKPLPSHRCVPSVLPLVTRSSQDTRITGCQIDKIFQTFWALLLAFKEEEQLQVLVGLNLPIFVNQPTKQPNKNPKKFILYIILFIMLCINFFCRSSL